MTWHGCSVAPHTCSFVSTSEKVGWESLHLQKDKKQPPLVKNKPISTIHLAQVNWSPQMRKQMLAFTLFAAGLHYPQYNTGHFTASSLAFTASP